MHTFDNLDAMDQLFKKHELVQLTQYKIHNFNSFITIKEMEFIILKPQKKFPGTDSFTGSFKK